MRVPSNVERVKAAIQILIFLDYICRWPEWTFFFVAVAFKLSIQYNMDE